MKGPDKIYVAIYNTEYISKDALLDWLRDEKRKNEKTYERNGDDSFAAMAYAYQEVIEKIESL